jgi:NADH dehydrogenase FAD-containing subunit
MTTNGSHPKHLVVIVGGGVAPLETLALVELASEQTAMTVVAPNDEFVYRPMTVRAPFAYPVPAVIRLRGS